MRIWPVASGVAWRTMRNVLKTPSLLLPTTLFPLFFFTAFAGGLSQVQNVPGFDYEGDYTSFQFVFVLLQSAAFGGVFTGFGIARDFESGFGKRLLLASPKRSGIVLGYALAALARWVITATLLTIVALARRDGRRRRRRSTSSASTRSRSCSTSPPSSGRRAWRSASARSRPPRSCSSRSSCCSSSRRSTCRSTCSRGWIETVATLNPITYVLEAGRSLISGAPTEVALAFALGLCAHRRCSRLWAFRGLRRAEAAG